MGCHASKDSPREESRHETSSPVNPALQKLGTDADRRLLQASSDGNAVECKKALQSGADLRAADWGGITALHLAAGGGHVATVTLLLGFNAELSWVDDSGGTALHNAASNGHLLMVE